MIPWIGDIVKLNPEGSKHSYLDSLRNKFPGNITVVSISGDPQISGLVVVKIGFQFVDICFPDGRFYAEPLGVPPLFTLVSGPDLCKVCANELYPIPVPGDIFEVIINSKTVKGHVLSCSCNSDNSNSWPNGDMNCGAHLENCDRLVYNAMTGWYRNGVLYRNKDISKISISAETLKKLNIDGRNTCAKCGCDLKCPQGLGLNYRYCPYCEP